LTSVARASAKCKLDLVGVQEVGRDRGGAKAADDCAFFCGNGKENELGAGFPVHKGIISAV
jgi:hypothetical protein